MCRLGHATVVITTKSQGMVAAGATNMVGKVLQRTIDAVSIQTNTMPPLASLLQSSIGISLYEVEGISIVKGQYGGV